MYTYEAYIPSQMLNQYTLEVVDNHIRMFSTYQYSNTNVELFIFVPQTFCGGAYFNQGG